MPHRFRPFDVYRRLFLFFGPQHWWPVGNFEITNLRNHEFEICVGAVLTQNTAWTNVEKALENLAAAGLLDVQKMAVARLSTIAKHIRPAGYFNQKAKKLRLFARFVLDRGGFQKLFAFTTPRLRALLLAQWGIGKETADSIILYAAKKPIFVIDTYTKRLLAEFKIQFKEYDDYRLFFERQLSRRVALWNEYHALIVAWAKLFRRDPKTARKIIGL